MSLQTLPWLPHSRCVLAQPMPDDAPLAADEAALVATVAPRRRRHFAAGRACAHAALQALGCPVPALRRAPGGGVEWPADVVGSVAHCEGAALAIVAATVHWQALGIDIEPDVPLPDDVAGYALSEAERRALAALPGGLAHWALPAFGAKECVHKCVHPLREIFLEFDEVAIGFNPDGTTFTATALSDQARRAFAGLHWHGHWQRRNGFVLTLLAGR